MANVFRRRAIKAIGGAALTTGLMLTAAAAREHTTTTAAATPSSVVSQYLQRWDAPNVFSFAAPAFPQNITYNYIDDRSRDVLGTRCDQKQIPQITRTARARMRGRVA